MTSDVTELKTANTKADEALAILDEAWAYYTPETHVAALKMDEANDDAFVFYYDAA